MDVLVKLEQSLKAVGAENRQTIKLEGFDLFIDAKSDAYHLSFAVPTSSANWQASVQAMKAAFAKHNRQARLEYFHEIHPDLRQVLEHEGFKQDMHAPVMVLDPAALSAFENTAQGNYKALKHTDNVLLEKALRGQSLAFGGDGKEGALIWFDNMIKGLELGSLMVAVLKKDNDLLSGASIQIGGGVGELAGVWTHPEKQQKGFAFELCHTLLQNYFDAGYDLCWLSAAEGAQRLYLRLGFKMVGTQLNYGLAK